MRMDNMPDQDRLLPSDSLKGIRLGISVSESVDLPRLGLLETHFRIVLGEIARCILLSGGQITYGGHLDPKGYTTFLMQELHRYGRRDKPLRICLAWQEHRKLSVTEIKNQKKWLGLHGEIICLDTDGAPVDPAKGRSIDPAPETDAHVCRKSLTSLRHYMTEHVDGRILIGGKRKEFQGDMPGLVEEAIISLKKNQPIYLAGGFGGVTLDIARILEVDDGSWFPEKLDVLQRDKRLEKGLAMLAEIKQNHNWGKLDNGLHDDENRKLAATHRPSEIAALIGLGLGRKFLRSVDE